MTFNFTKDGKQRTIEEIIDAEEHERLGVAGGESLGHCVYTASRHCRDFFTKVKYYQHCDSSELDGGYYKVIVAFYK